MKPLLRLLTLTLLVSTMTCWAEPALAARLASVSGETAGSEVRDDAEFKLSDHSEVKIAFNISERGKDCAVKVRVHRQQPNGNWLVVNTILRTNKSINDSRSLTLPAGSYKIEVISKHARYDVSVDL